MATLLSMIDQEYHDREFQLQLQGGGPTVSNPSCTIPSELLSEIFLQCVDGAMDPLNTIYIPLLVSQICTRWRKTALATPRLWSRLFLQLGSGPGTRSRSNSASSLLSTRSFQTSSPPTKRKLELVREWLARSGACPLKVYLLCEEGMSFDPLSPILNALMEHSERWQDMCLYLPHASFKALTRVRRRLPLLRELSFGTSDDEPSELAGKCDAFSVAPRLRSLEFVNCSPLAFKLPWSQLTTIPMMVVSIDDCIDVLLQTSRLEHGGFLFIDGFPSVHGRAFRHQHEHIREFSIMTPPGNEMVDLRGLFSQLCFPHLDTLHILNLRSPFCIEFVSFLSRLRCLRTLHLRKTALLDHQLVQGLKYLPTLTSLIVYSASSPEAPTVTHNLLSALTWGEGNTGERLLPLLTKLELTIDYNVADDFIEMAMSRVLVTEDGQGPAPGRLESIRIRPTEGLTDRIYTAFAQIASYGVEVSVEDLAGGTAQLGPSM